MTIRLTRSGPEDRPAILALLAQARGDDLSRTERTRQGFVQGRMDEAMLARFQSGSGVFVARDDNTLAGVAMTSRPDMSDHGPPARAVAAVTKAMPALSRDRFFLYGPVAVDRRYQGQGLLTRLLREVCTCLQEQFDLGVAFVELSNHKSLAIHRHYPMEEDTGFTFKGRTYVVFTFAPGCVLAHYA